MNTCTKVFLRKKEISGDRISLYLDFYPPIRNPHTNRLSRRESLGIYLYGHPSNAREREFNASMMEKGRGYPLPSLRAVPQRAVRLPRQREAAHGLPRILPQEVFQEVSEVENRLRALQGL